MLAIDSGTIYVRMKHIIETHYQKLGRQYLKQFFYDNSFSCENRIGSQLAYFLKQIILF